MMTDFRALCAELLDWAEVTAAHYIQLPDVLLRARAALADEPAVPEGREPAAVTEQPNWRGLCEELVDAWLKGDDIVSAMNRARAVLTRWGNRQGSLTSSPPADGEVAELTAWLQEEADDYECIGCEDSAAKCKRAAELLQRQVLVPVSVSERPWEREGWCDAEGKCWIRGKVEGDWRLINPTNSGVPNLKYCFTHCLPAHALPLPEVDE